jgi:hypothetical protein
MRRDNKSLSRPAQLKRVSSYPAIHPARRAAWRFHCILLVGLSLPWFASAQSLQPEDIYQKLLPSVMTLHIENSRGETYVGTAFLALNTNTAVTAWHVVSDAAKVSAKFSDGRTVEVIGLIDKDEEHDLALIRVDGRGRPFAPLSAATPRVGSRAYVIGAPKGFDFSITDGLISQIQNIHGCAQYQVSCPFSGGDSGGPVVNDRGEVVGVAAWTKMDAQNLNFAIPSTFLGGMNSLRTPAPWRKHSALSPVKANIPAAEKLSPPGHAANLKTSSLSPDVNQEEIQQALDALPEGGEVVLAPGTYEIRQPIILRYDHQTLRGSGPATVLHLVDNANCPVVILGSPMTTPQRTTSHLRLADLVINGNRLNQQAELWHTATDGSVLNNNGIDIWDVNDSTVEGVVCRSCRSGGLVTAATRRLNVSDFTAYDNQFDGLACYLTEDCHFSGLNLYDNLGAGISLDLSFNHNVFNDAVLTGNDLGVFMRDSRSNSFQDLTISKSRKNGVFMAQAGTRTASGWALRPGTECIGNNFKRLMIANCGGVAFLVNDNSCKDNLIGDASFQDNRNTNLTQMGDNLVRVEELSGH